MTHVSYSRRSVGKAGLAAAAAGLSVPFLNIRAASARDAKLVFWLQPNFNKVADDLLVAQAKDYARSKGLKDNELQIEVVPGGEVSKRMAAALEIGAPPDVTRTNEEDLVKWGSIGHLLDITPVVNEMKTRPGGINEGSLPLATRNGQILGAPMGIAANAAHVRADKFKEAGYDSMPATWEGFIEAGRKITKPPFYSFGMALGLVPSDSLVDLMSVVSAYGGSLLDAQNRPAFESDGTIAAFKLVEAMYNKDKIIPRGSLSWDNSGNNKAFQSGQVAYIMNPTSVYSSLVTDKSPFLDATVLDRPPGGPAGRFSTASTDHYSVFKKAPNPELAMGLVQHFLKPENYSRFIVEAGGRYLPIYPSLLSDPFWTSKPAFAGLLEAARSARSTYAPGKITPALSEVVNRSLIISEVQNMLVKGKEPARAVADAHKTMVDVFKRLGEPT
ncbi:MAG: extracellular solute-binding protein [Rhizobiales bacterium]|nr:extracellular solute-binding protein [Hyphomicrobiales bacterium]